MGCLTQVAKSWPRVKEKIMSEKSDQLEAGIRIVKRYIKMLEKKEYRESDIEEELQTLTVIIKAIKLGLEEPE